MVQEKRPMTADDLFSLTFLSDLAADPTGKRLVYVATRIEPKTDKYTSHLWMTSGDGAGRQFTWGGHRDRCPRWSPCGSRLAFLSNRPWPAGKDEAKKTRLFLIEADGGEAYPLPGFDGEVTDFAWSPDGKHVAVVSRDGPELPADESDEEKSDVKVITRLKYRVEGRGLLDERRSHIWIVPLEPEGEPWRATAGDFDHVDPAWHPDGERLVFVARRDEDEDYSRNRDLWCLNVTDGDLSPLLTDLGTLSNPVYSPDGRSLAFLRTVLEPGRAGGSQLWVVEGGEEPRRLAAELDRPVNSNIMTDIRAPGARRVSLQWSKDSDAIYFIAPDWGSSYVYRAGMDGQTAMALGEEGAVVWDFALWGRSMVYSSGGPTNPADLYMMSDGAGPHRLTEVNEDLLSGLSLSRPVQFRYRGAGGWDIQGWYMLPQHSGGETRHPVLLEIHGGPHGTYGWGFFHEFQVLAGAGYLVVYTNPRGSQGYGEDFASACIGDWGGEDYRDIMAGLDWVLSDQPERADEDRTGVLGGSYGGFMTCWSVTQTDRFRAAVAQRVVANRYSFYGTSDIGPMFGEHQCGGHPWTSEEEYLSRSPVRYVDRVVTPLLIIHSEEDYRCPIEQAEQFYTFLKRLGKEVTFVRFPGENHDLSRSGRPKHRLERLQWILRWFDKHLKDGDRI